MMAMAWEYSFLRWIVENLQHPVLSWVLKIFTLTGEVGIIWFVLAIIMVFFKKTRKAGIVAIFAIALVAGLNEFGIKYIIERDRPYTYEFGGGDASWLYTYMEGFKSGGPLNEMLVPSSFSFMSGHTLSSFLFGFVVAYYHREFRVPALLLSFIMSFTRLYFGFHYLTDVLASVIFAFFGSWLMIYIANKHETWFIALWSKIVGLFQKRKEA